MSTTETDLSPNKAFVVRMNLAMKEGIENGADPTLMAKSCLNTARELYDYHGAGEEYSTYHEFVVETGFESAEIEELLETVESQSRISGKQ